MKINSNNYRKTGNKNSKSQIKNGNSNAENYKQHYKEYRVHINKSRKFGKKEELKFYNCSRKDKQENRM